MADRWQIGGRSEADWRSITGNRQQTGSKPAADQRQIGGQSLANRQQIEGKRENRADAVRRKTNTNAKKQASWKKNTHFCGTWYDRPRCPRSLSSRYASRASSARKSCATSRATPTSNTAWTTSSGGCRPTGRSTASAGARGRRNTTSSRHETRPTTYRAILGAAPQRPFLLHRNGALPRSGSAVPGCGVAAGAPLPQCRALPRGGDRRKHARAGTPCADPQGGDRLRRHYGRVAPHLLRALAPARPRQ